MDQDLRLEINKKPHNQMDLLLSPNVHQFKR